MAVSMVERLFWDVWLGQQSRRWQRLPYLAPATIQARQDAAVRRIVAHAYKTVPFYRQVMDDRALLPRDIQCASDLARLPLVDRSQVQSSPELFGSSRWNLEKLPSSRTSGTTGEKLTIWYDPACLMRVLLLNRRDTAIQSNLSIGHRRTLIINVADCLAEFVARYYRERVWVPGRVRSDLATVSMSSPVAQQVEKINTFRPDILVAGVSALDQLWNYHEHSDGSLALPRIVLATSETLDDRLRQRVEHNWGVPVVGRYGSSEFLKMGFECRQQSGYHIHSDWCAVRIVDGRGCDVPPGVPGEVVVSGLWNRAFVLLNYRLGDWASLTREPCVCGCNLPRLVGLDGRRVNRIEMSSGRVVYSIQMVHFVKMCHGVERFQIIRERRHDFSVSVVLLAGTDEQAVESYLLDGLRDILGGEAGIRVVSVADIPVSPGGKRPVYISHVV